MGKLLEEAAVVVGQIKLKKQMVSRRRPPQSRSRRGSKIEVVVENGGVIAFDRYQINAVGAYLFSDYLYCEGEILKMRLFLPAVESALIIEGEVVNVNVDKDSGMGIVFRKMGIRHKRMLQDYVARRFAKRVVKDVK